LSYAFFGVQMVYSIVQGRELVVLGEGADLFYLPLPASLAGKTLAEAQIGARTGVNVIAVQEDGRLVTNIARDKPLVRGSHLVALCSAEQREQFDAVYG
jgi:K+/H+ antiporter YhaU regulatory subunit KhtT